MKIIKYQSRHPDNSAGVFTALIFAFCAMTMIMSSSPMIVRIGIAVITVLALIATMFGDFRRAFHRRLQRKMINHPETYIGVDNFEIDAPGAVGHYFMEFDYSKRFIHFPDDHDRVMFMLSR